MYVKTSDIRQVRIKGYDKIVAQAVLIDGAWDIKVTDQTADLFDGLVCEVMHGDQLLEEIVLKGQFGVYTGFKA